MSNFKVGDVVMWSTASHWSNYSGWEKSKIVSETKTEFKLENGKRVLKRNSSIRGVNYKTVRLFDVKEWEEDIAIREESSMTNFIQKNFSEYLGLLNRKEIKKLYSEMQEKIKEQEHKNDKSDKRI